jgi:hypothetical protein
VEKINNVGTALAIVCVVFAVLVTGGLTVISSPTSTMQSASAARSGFGGHACFQELDAEACTSSGGGGGQGGGGQGGGGGGGNRASCSFVNGEPVCESVPGGGGGRH